MSNLTRVVTVICLAVPAVGCAQAPAGVPASDVPEISTFVSWVGESGLAQYGLDIRDPQRLGALLVVRLEHLRTPSDRMDAVRQALVSAGVREDALSSASARHVAEAALRDIAEAAVTRADRQAIRWLARAGFGLEIPAQGEAEVTGPRVRRAQLQALRLRVAHPDRPEMFDSLVAMQVRGGIDPGVFTAAALHDAALQETVEQLRGVPAPARVRIAAQARRAYGIDGQELYEFLDAGEAGVAELLDQYLSAPSGSAQQRELLKRAQERPVKPAELPRVIGAIEVARTPEERKALLRLLRNDWSNAGVDYLYGYLSRTDSGAERVAVLGVLADRDHVRAADLLALVESTDQDDVRRSALGLLRRAVARDDADTCDALYAALDSGEARSRELAAAALASLRRSREVAPLLERVRRAPSPEQRAQLVLTLRPIGSHPEVAAFLLDCVQHDASPAVRKAAVDALVLVPNFGGAIGEREERTIALLEQAAHEMGDAATRDAIARKVASYREQTTAVRLSHRRNLILTTRLALEAASASLKGDRSEDNVEFVRRVARDADGLLQDTTPALTTELDLLRAAREAAERELNNASPR